MNYRSYVLPVYKRILFHENQSFLKNLLLTPDGRHGYIQIPKAGCSTVKHRFLTSLGVLSTNQIGQKELHDDRSFWVAYDSSDFFNHIRQFKFKIFSVVRNPYSRILSAFREKIELRKDSDKFISDLGFSTKKQITFNMFLQKLSKKKPADLDPHFRPQSYIIPPELSRFILVGKLELLDENLDAIFNEFKISKAAKNSRLIHGTKSSENEIMEKYFSKENIELVRRIYKVDFLRFGYSVNFKNLNNKKSNELIGDGSTIDLTKYISPSIVRFDHFIRTKILNL